MLLPPPEPRKETIEDVVRRACAEPVRRTRAQLTDRVCELRPSVKHTVITIIGHMLKRGELSYNPEDAHGVRNARRP